MVWSEEETWEAPAWDADALVPPLIVERRSDGVSSVIGSRYTILGSVRYNQNHAKLTARGEVPRHLLAPALSQLRAYAPDETSDYIQLHRNEHPWPLDPGAVVTAIVIM